MTNENININPWKGLNFYKEGEIIYGRDAEIESLTQYVVNNTQTVLYGKSGIGKSSILNAGVFPRARQNGLIPVPIRFNHDMDGGSKPALKIPYINQIINAVHDAGIEVREVVPVVDKDKETLWEYLHRNLFYDKNGKETEPLFVIDQFEEMFTLQSNESIKVEFFAQLADLLNDVTPAYISEAKHLASEKSNKKHSEGAEADGLNIFIDLGGDDDGGTDYIQNPGYHIVFTLREDFLSYLERYTTYIPVMKSNRYALQPLNEEQAAEIILKPREGLVSKDVANLIIQKVTGRTDFKLDGIPEIEVEAAILSLYLSRLYEKKGDKDAITANLVNQFGGSIIKDFYEESITNIPNEEIEFLEYQLLTPDNRRDNQSRSVLLEKVTPEDLRTLVDRKLLRQFSYGGDIRVEYIHDILCPIVAERLATREAQKAQEAERLEALRLVEEEQRKREEVERQAAIERRRSKRKLRFAIGLMIAIFALAFTWWLLFRAPQHHYYAAFTTVNGWPQGVGKTLSGEQKNNLVVFYRLTREGWLGTHPYTKVEVYNTKGKLSTNVLIESPLVPLRDIDNENDENAREFARKQLSTAYWTYTADRKGNMIRCTAFSLNDEELYSEQYYRSTQESDEESGNNKETVAANDSIKLQSWLSYIDSEGKSLQVRDNGADRIRLVLSGGIITRYQFFNEIGIPQQNTDSVFGYDYEITQEGTKKRKVALDEFGDPINGTEISYTKYDDLNRWIESSDGKAIYDKQMIVYASASRTDTLRFDDNSKLIYHSELLNGGKTLQTHTYTSDALDLMKCRYENGKLAMSRSITYLPGSKLVGEKIEFLALKDSSNSNTLPYFKEVRQGDEKSYTITYWKSNDGKNWQKGTAKNQLYHKEAYYNDTIRDVAYDNIVVNKVRREVVTFTDTLGKPCVNNYVRNHFKEINEYDMSGAQRSTMWYNEHGRCVSVAFEIDNNGVTIGRYVFADSITKKPIRCPMLDYEGITYCKMRYIKTHGEIASRKCINEFGEKSLMTYKDLIYESKVLPFDWTYKGSEDNNVGINAIQVSQEELRHIGNDQSVNMVYIADNSGTYYKAGVRSGDILISERGNNIKIAQCDVPNNTYKILDLTLETGAKGAEVFKAYFTSPEINRLNKAISKR